MYKISGTLGVIYIDIYSKKEVNFSPKKSFKAISYSYFPGVYWKSCSMLSIEYIINTL